MKKRILSLALALVMVIMLIPAATAASGNLPNPLEIEGADDFYEYLSKFTQNLVAGISSQEAQLMAIYDFIVRNFETQREGPAIDGSKRPPLVEVPPVSVMTIFVSENNSLFFAWELLTSGQGVCDDFVALFAYMAKSIGYDARNTGGNYINTNGTRSPHAWTAILIDGGWYFFDPHIETNNLIRNRNNSNYSPRLWWKQPVGAQQTQSRYETDHVFTSIPQTTPAPAPVPTPTPVPSGNPLDTASSWAREGLTATIAKGFVPSDLQNNYRNTITRAEFCRLAVKWVEYQTGKSIDTVMSEKGVSRNPSAFTDTSDPAILAAFALGITSGVGNNQFNPNGSFTREQAAGMILNVGKVIGMNTSNIPPSGFADISSVSSWAVDGVNFCFANGIMQGVGNNRFNPKDPYTREQSILTFNNIRVDAASAPAPTLSAEYFEGEIYTLINWERAKAGLAPLLVWDDRVAAVARAHSVDMATRNFVGLTNPDGLSPPDRLRNAGISFSLCGEIPATVFNRTPETLIRELIDAGAGVVILNPDFTRLGVGYHNGYITITFVAD